MKTYSNYKDIVYIPRADGTVFELPLYHNAKESSQICCFIMSGNIIEYGIAIRRFIFADRNFVPIGKGDFQCDSNKRKSLAEAKKNVKYASKYQFTSPDTGDSIELIFSFVTESHIITLAQYLVPAAKAFFTSVQHLKRVGDSWEEISIEPAKIVDKKSEATE